MKNQIDHFAIGAESLDQGVTHLQELLGVEIPRGGKHDAMSTHNCVTFSGNDSFLEVIAIDPDAPEPGRTRWFTLDDPVTQTRLAQSPSPLCWVVRTDDLDAVVESSPVDLGEVVLFTRGDRSWRLTVPQDGSLPEQGLIPAFIEWSPGLHPSANMKDLDLRLESVNLYHPEVDRMTSILEKLGVEHLARVIKADQAKLSFSLQTRQHSRVELI
ncbi:MAG: VOC family protein [Pseudomonadota bacterium]